MNIKQLFAPLGVLVALSVFPLSTYAKTCAWGVTFTGTVSGNPIVKTGLVKTITPGLSMSGSANGSNPFEMAMLLGSSPVTTPGKGNFQFATNTALLGGTQQLDVAYVGANNTQYPLTAYQDSKLSSVGLNVWIGLSQMYQASSGGVNFRLLNGNQYIEGIVKIVGRQAIFGGQSTYQGSFSGRLLGCN